MRDPHRICARPSCLLPAASLRERENKKLKIQTVELSTTEPVNSEVEADGKVELSLVKSAENAGEYVEVAPSDACLPTVATGSHDNHSFYYSPKEEDYPLKLDFFIASTGRDVECAGPCNTTDTNNALLGTHCPDSGAAKNCTFEKCTRYDIPYFTTGEVQKEKSYMHRTAKCEGNGSVSSKNISGAILNPISAPASLGRQRSDNFIMQENKESGVYSFVPRDDDTKDTAARAAIAVGLSCEVKLKPLSALGGKRRKELFKQEDGVSVGFGGKTPRVHLNPWFLSENGRCLKYD